MGFLDRIREANTWEPASFRAFRVAGERMGCIKRDFAERLRRWPEVFSVTDHEVRLAEALDLPDAPAAARTAAVSEVLLTLRAEGVIRGWRDEAYPVAASRDAAPCLLIERAALPLFGVRGYGVHMSGYVRRDDGLHLWVARRARDKPTSPGKLDQLVAGGQPHGIGLAENLVKEAAEEASIPSALAARALPVGTVSYCMETREGLRPDVLFNFDLELPQDFVPLNTDGEVESFELMPMSRVMETVRESADFKFNCSLVVIDFLIRHGFIGPEAPHYVEICRGLQGLEEAAPQT